MLYILKNGCNVTALYDSSRFASLLALIQVAIHECIQNLNLLYHNVDVDDELLQAIVLVQKQRVEQLKVDRWNVFEIQCCDMISQRQRFEF